jgi:DNA-directed RNA polymerase subunit RPC12/RpoP
MVNCSVCGNPLQELGGLPPGAIVIGGDPSGLDLWMGNVCVPCAKVYCADDIEVGGPTPCPSCGEPTLPAQRMNLQRIGITP